MILYLHNTKVTFLIESCGFSTKVDALAVNLVGPPTAAMPKRFVARGLRGSSRLRYCGLLTRAARLDGHL